MVRKTVRLTAEEEYKLKKMSEISGLTESDILRLFFYNITVIREKPSKELIKSKPSSYSIKKTAELKKSA